MSQQANQLTKIGVFYDGSYFNIVSNYYAHHHDKKARISLSGLHKFIRHRIAREEDLDVRYCQVIDAHYFRGRFSAQQIAAKGDEGALHKKLYNERVWDDALIKENVTPHYLPMNRMGEEKGIDVWLALDAFELSVYKQFNVVVLIAGDSDYIPLVRKLNTLGIRVMVLGWSFTYLGEDGEPRNTRASHLLLGEASYPVHMAELIEACPDEERQALSDLFMPPSRAARAEAPRTEAPRTEPPRTEPR